MARQLVVNVCVDGQWYGPDYGDTDPPADVAEQITNPAAWSSDETKARTEPSKQKQKG